MSGSVVGVDGWRGGWVVVRVHNGAFEGATVFTTIGDAVAAHPDVEVVAIDIPIGLPARGVRAADRDAKQALAERSSTLFLTPPRDVIQAESYDIANRMAKDRDGRGLSRQSYALRSKILEVDAIARDDRRLVEVHPELSFAELAGRPLPSKKTWNGMQTRRQLLRSVGIEVPADLGEAGTVPADDVLDAAAAAWTAHRVATHQAYSLPDPPEHDETGLPMAIWV